MEKIGNLESKTVISELTQGRELANQLKNQLHPTKSSEACGFLVEKILSSYENALSLLNCIDMPMLGETAASPNSLACTPTSQDSNPFSKDQIQRDDVYKKRKILPKWSEEVRVCTATGLDGPLDDGYNWRKYGQKDILGASFPRSYYRCTYRHSQGCLATKQVQKSDEDPSVYEVNYRGRHTCIPERLKQDYNLKDNKKQTEQKPASIKVETPDLEALPSFSFPSTPIVQSHFTETNSSLFTYESSYFLESLCQMNHLQTSELDFTDIISAPTSVPNSPFGDWDFTTEEFDPIFRS